MNMKLTPSWNAQLESEMKQPYFAALLDFLNSQNQEHPNAVFPEKDLIFRALDECAFEDVRVVLLGQDPYPTRGHAHGLCFSVAKDVSPLPKSLNNIFKELESDMGLPPRKNGDLSHWAQQGVLMLNTVLTVREGDANSHAKQGWEKFTDAIIERLAKNKTGIVYILWGAKAQEKARSVDESTNLIIRSPHPSPLSSYRGFFGSKPFSRTNEYLEERGLNTIDW